MQSTKVHKYIAVEIMSVDGKVDRQSLVLQSVWICHG